MILQCQALDMFYGGHMHDNQNWKLPCAQSAIIWFLPCISRTSELPHTAWSVASVDYQIRSFVWPSRKRKTNRNTTGCLTMPTSDVVTLGYHRLNCKDYDAISFTAFYLYCFLFCFFLNNGKSKAIIDKTKKVTTIGLVKNINQFPSKITNDCLKVPSTNSPKINPIITGTTEKPYLLIKNPTTPKKSIIHTSIMD